MSMGPVQTISRQSHRNENMPATCIGLVNHLVTDL